MLASPTGLVRSKAFTTHGNYSEGILNALDVASEQLGTTTADILPKCSAFVNGSTIVTNVITELRGASVGVLITRGFKDTFRLAGGARRADYDDHVQLPPPDVVRRDCIEEISERVTSDGAIVAPLNDEEVRDAVLRLREKGVEAIAVCYLWSFREPAHERRTREIITDEFPEAFVTLSSDVHPVIREFPRFMTAVFNCMSNRATTRYVEQLQDRLSQSGFEGALTFFQGIGGSVGVDVVQSDPITLMASGPAGGVMGARYVAEQLGLKNILIGDMGGTSFDTAVLPGLEVAVAKRATFGPFHTGVNILDVVSVGAGGGSIAWIDSRGVPQVGPHSAGSEPGPACYGRGGTEATVTDANVVLGLIDPDNYLKGRHHLDVQAASDVIQQRIGDPLAWTVEHAAAAIYDLAVIEMANALRVVSIERGHDPREFTFFSYGGGLGLFAAEICRRLGCPNIVIPDNASAFSAYGVLIADYVRQYDRTINWVLSDSARAPEINAIAGEMIAQAVADAAQEGIPKEDLVIERSGDFRFLGQVYEVPVPLPNRDLTEDDAGQLERDFPQVYERSHGEGTAWVGSPVVLLNLSIKVTNRRPKPSGREQEPHDSYPAPAAVAHRDAFLPIERRAESLPVFPEAELPPGASVDGPCIIDVGDTTLYIPENVTCTRDRYFNFALSI
jgi:N-methylhydantoinase A